MNDESLHTSACHLCALYGIYCEGYESVCVDFVTEEQLDADTYDAYIGEIIEFQKKVYMDDYDEMLTEHDLFF